MIYLPRDWQELPDGSFYLQDRKVKCAWTWMENRWILLKPDGQQCEFAVEHRIYDGAGLRALLLDAGFASVELYGGLAGEPYDAKATRLVAVARRVAA